MPGRPRIPEHLELLLSDEPFVDLYTYGPWRVPDGMLSAIAANLDDLAADSDLYGNFRPGYGPYIPRTSVSTSARRR